MSLTVSDATKIQRKETKTGDHIACFAKTGDHVV
jgi:hypothetical protein